MKNILTVEYPPITSFPNIANPLSILWSYREKFLPWFCDHYIQIVTPKDFRKDGTWATFYDHSVTNNSDHISSCPFLRIIKTDRTTKNNFLDTFMDFIEAQINNGYYINLVLEQFYLSCSQCYMKNSFRHPTFINGYDKTKRIVMISDFFDRKYSRKEVSYNEINQSYLNCAIHENDPEWYLVITLFKYIDFNYLFNIDLLKLYLDDYLHCKDSFLKYKFAFNYQNQDIYFGLDFYNAIIEDCVNSQENVDIKTFHLLCDHKEAMKIRVEYLMSNKLLNVNLCNDIYESCNELLMKTLQLRNLVLKYIIKKDESLQKDIIAKCYGLCELDKKFTVKLLSALV